MTKLNDKDKPVRVGVFGTVQGADRAVHGLLAAGFTKDEITVICSDETKERYFREYEHQDPAGSNTPAAAAAGSAIGAALGSLAVIAGGLATGGIGLLAAGGVGLWGGAVAGGLIGAMTTRGVEKEAANYYDQSVTRGKILVVAEALGDEAPAQLARAERVLTDAGAEPIALEEG